MFSFYQYFNVGCNLRQFERFTAWQVQSMRYTGFAPVLHSCMGVVLAMRSPNGQRLSLNVRHNSTRVNTAYPFVLLQIALLEKRAVAKDLHTGCFVVLFKVFHCMVPCSIAACRW